MAQSLKCSLGLSAIPQHKLREAFQYAKKRILEESKPDPNWKGDAIILAGGGRYLGWVLNNVRNTRRWWNGPIQVWCLNSREIPDVGVFTALGVEVVNAQDILGKWPMRRFGGWGLKHFAVLHCPFQRVLSLDADCFATKAGIELLNHPALSCGAILFQDVKRCATSDLQYFSCSIQPPRFLKPPQQELESGQMVFDKKVCHAALRMTNWINEHQDSWWEGMHGDKASLELAFRGMKAPFALGTCTWKDWGIRHVFDGKWCFAHALGTKRGKAPFPDLTTDG